MAKSKAINLLPQEEFEASIIGRLLKWATGTFRIIVIVTEMIVMGAFLSRFWLDSQNSDLTDTMSIKVAQIQSQKDFETSFRLLQKKLSIVKAVTGATKLSNQFLLVASKVPQEVTLSGVGVDGSSIQIKGSSSSDFGIAQFISNLQVEKTFKSVDLGTLATSQENQGQTDFSVNIIY